MAKNSDMPNHSWKIAGTEVVDKHTFFLYCCTKCPAKTFNGTALVPPYDTECKK